MIICSTCKQQPAIINRPFEPFIDKHFGPIHDQTFLLCTDCDFLFTHGYLARLTDAIVDVHKLAGVYTLPGDVYVFLQSMTIATRTSNN